MERAASTDKIRIRHFLSGVYKSRVFQIKPRKLSQTLHLMIQADLLSPTRLWGHMHMNCEIRKEIPCFFYGVTALGGGGEVLAWLW